MYEKQSKIIWFFVSHGDKYIVLDISWTPHHFGEIKERTLDEALFKFKLFLQIPLLPRSLSHCGLQNLCFSVSLLLLSASLASLYQTRMTDVLTNALLTVDSVKSELLAAHVHCLFPTLYIESLGLICRLHPANHCLVKPVSSLFTTSALKLTIQENLLFLSPAIQWINLSQFSHLLSCLYKYVLFCCQ